MQDHTTGACVFRRSRTGSIIAHSVNDQIKHGLTKLIRVANSIIGCFFKVYTSNIVGFNERHIWHALRSVYDPEIPVNIADLGLIYAVRIAATRVEIDMTLTAPGCGMGPVLIEEVKDRVRQVPNLTDVEVELVFDPPWSRDMMSEEAQLELGVF